MDNPLVSILIFNYDSKLLKDCLEVIFKGSLIDCAEVVVIDDATEDGSWEIASEYALRFDGKITIKRNRKPMGPLINLSHSALLSHGRFCVALSGDQLLDDEYVKRCVSVMQSDPVAEFAFVYRRETLLRETAFQQEFFAKRSHSPTIFGKPLVSILCFNFNYGKYLEQCLESVFSQTYQNIELCFSDNASTDNSWETALKFYRRFKDRMTLIRNRMNFGSDVNLRNCIISMEGRYFVFLCSDDALEPEYVEKCVRAFEIYPEAGFVMVHRKLMNEEGEITCEPPFYNKSCIIPGDEQAAVYMMSSVNPSISQIVYNRSIIDAMHDSPLSKGIGYRFYSPRIFDFNICTQRDMIYLKDPLLLHRVHSRSDTSIADKNLFQVIGVYVLNHEFAEIASIKNIQKVLKRLPESVNKLANLSLRYSVRFLLNGDNFTAKRYFYLAAALNPDICKDAVWQELENYWSADDSSKEKILSQLISVDNLVSRDVSYNPPPGSIPIYI